MKRMPIKRSDLTEKQKVTLLALQALTFLAAASYWVPPQWGMPSLPAWLGAAVALLSLLAMLGVFWRAGAISGWLVAAFVGTLLVAAGISDKVNAASPVRANYEIVIQNEMGSWTAHSSADVVSGRPIEHDLGPYRLSLTPTIEVSGQYTLEVSIGMPSRDAETIYVPSSKRFPGTLGYPLEFESVRGTSSVKGALMMDFVGS